MHLVLKAITIRPRYRHNHKMKHHLPLNWLFRWTSYVKDILHIDRWLQLQKKICNAHESSRHCKPMTTQWCCKKPQSYNFASHFSLFIHRSIPPFITKFIVQETLIAFELSISHSEFLSDDHSILFSWRLSNGTNTSDLEWPWSSILQFETSLIPMHREI